MDNLRSLNTKLQGLQIDEKSCLEDVCLNLKSLQVTQGKKRLVGEALEEDEDYYIMTCTGVDETKDIYVNIRVKRNKRK
jgi:hypothetical protein